jgi:lipopolysaccharide biosynthesis glycosyltransferase
VIAAAPSRTEKYAKFIIDNSIAKYVVRSTCRAAEISITLHAYVVVCIGRVRAGALRRPWIAVRFATQNIWLVQRCRVDLNEKYFNAGVLMINLRLWKQRNKGMRAGHPIRHVPSAGGQGCMRLPACGC